MSSLAEQTCSPKPILFLINNETGNVVEHFLTCRSTRRGLMNASSRSELAESALTGGGVGESRRVSRLGVSGRRRGGVQVDVTTAGFYVPSQKVNLQSSQS